MPAVDEAPYADNAALLDALRELGDTLIERALLRRQLDGSEGSEGSEGSGRSGDRLPARPRERRLPAGRIGWREIANWDELHARTRP